MSADQAHLADQFATLEQQHEAGRLGMWIFLATEIMVFGAIFTGYAVYRTQYPAAFEAASGRLNLWIGAVNTVVLLTSSLTMALAVHATHAEKRRMLIACLGLTALLGTAFLVLKGFEYAGDYRDRLIPTIAFNPADWQPGEVQHVELFLTFYYFLTLLHALHLIIGIGLLTILTWFAWRGRFSAEHDAPVEISGLYWHFVDVVWIFLLPLLYLIGTHSI